MVRISCDVCGRTRPATEEIQSEEWILGYDLESESKAGLQRSVRFLDRWDDRRVLELGILCAKLAGFGAHRQLRL